MHANLAAEFTLDNKVAVVTGAGSGIGQELSGVFAEAGARVIIADINEEGLAATAAIVEQRGSQSVRHLRDVGQKSQVDKLAEDTMRQFGRIDAWANIAAIVQFTPAIDVTEEEMDRQIAVNQKGVFWGCAAAGRAMKAAGKGSIVNISSGAADSSPPGGSVYAMTKSAVNACTRSFATELGPFGIRVNTVAPGYIYTPMSRAAQESDPQKREEWLAKMRSQSPLGLTGVPRDIALAVLYLVSDATRFVTGQIIRPNGGLGMH